MNQYPLPKQDPSNPLPHQAPQHLVHYGVGQLRLVSIRRVLEQGGGDLRVCRA